MNQASDDCDRRSLLSAGAVLSSFFALSLSSTPYVHEWDTITGH